MSALCWLLGGVAVAVVVGLALGRYALHAGLALIILGVGPMAALYVYETYFYTSGDTSSYGMLSTIMLLLLTPPGIVLFLLGLLRRD